jgi:predicted histone-like DNA-binding protein
MSVLDYDFYENPPSKGSEGKSKFHARVVPKGTMTTDMLARFIQQASSLTEGDVKAVLIALSDIAKSKLADGYRIYLEGLGYFQLTLSCPPVNSLHEIRAESVRVKTIVFRPEADFKNFFKTVAFVRKPVKQHSQPHSGQEPEELLAAYFENNTYMNASQFRTLCGFTKTTAARRLKQLVEAGTLRRINLCHQPVYEYAKASGGHEI